MEDKEPFISRWSRRKLEAKDNAPADLPPAELASAAPNAPAAEPTAPKSPDSPQDRTPEYREFFDPQVDEKLRQKALKGLFSDPHFNVMDGLDTYIDDYSIADPIPEAMLRQLNQAKNLFLFDDEEKGKTAEGVVGPAAVGEAAAAAPAAAVDTTARPEPSQAGESNEHAEVGTSAAAAVPVVGSKNI